MLAKNLNAPRGIWFYALSLTTFASKLAPTGVMFARDVVPPPNPFLTAHQLVTERPSVAQNHAQVTAVTLPQKLPPKNFIFVRALDPGAFQPS